MDVINQHDIQSEDLEEFVVCILKGIKRAATIDAKYVLRLDNYNVQRIAELYSKCKWIEIY